MNNNYLLFTDRTNNFCSGYDFKAVTDGIYLKWSNLRGSLMEINDLRLKLETKFMVFWVFEAKFLWITNLL